MTPCESIAGIHTKADHPVDVLVEALLSQKPAAGYSAEDLDRFTVQLKAAGCTHKRGRPRKGDRPLGPELKKLMLVAASPTPELSEAG